MYEVVFETETMECSVAEKSMPQGQTPYITHLIFFQDQPRKSAIMPTINSEKSAP